MKTNSNHGCGCNPNPQAFITKGKQRLKQFDNTVYLNDGDEFEIELFNPTSNKVLAKIELNGKSIGSGIILRPGERVFLERYLDEAKKFLFETYAVSGNNDDVARAIANNGKLMVKFYNEVSYYTASPYQYTSTNWNYTTNPPQWAQPSFTTCYCNHTESGDLSLTGSITTNSFNCCSNTTDTVRSKSVASPGVSVNEVDHSFVETGRIEKGSHSNQSFEYDYSKFKSYPDWAIAWKILPMSQKQLTKEDLKVFCVSCGHKKRKQSERYCSQCGTKY